MRHSTALLARLGLHIRKLLPFKNRMEPTANLASCCETGPRCGANQLSVRRIVLAELVDHLLVDLIGSKSREQSEPSSGLVGLTESGDRIVDPATTHSWIVTVPRLKVFANQVSHLFGQYVRACLFGHLR